MKTIPDLLEQNRVWAATYTTADPQFFNRLCAIQRPEYLWVGCSDSRVPANQIVALDMNGTLVWQRNLAREYAPVTIIWGPGSSPTLYKEIGRAHV